MNESSVNPACESSTLSERQRNNPATLARAIDGFRKIEPVAKQHGYLTSMYGSVVRNGEGRDVDILLVPWRTAADYLGAVNAIADALGGRVNWPIEFGIMQTLSVTVVDFAGIVYDIQFRHNEVSTHPAVERGSWLKERKGE